MDGCICLSNEPLDPDPAALWEEIAASASGRLSSSSWLLRKSERERLNDSHILKIEPNNILKSGRSAGFALSTPRAVVFQRETLPLKCSRAGWEIVNHRRRALTS